MSPHVLSPWWPSLPRDYPGGWQGKAFEAPSPAPPEGIWAQQDQGPSQDPQPQATEPLPSHPCAQCLLLPQLSLPSPPPHRPPHVLQGCSSHSGVSSPGTQPACLLPTVLFVSLLPMPAGGAVPSGTCWSGSGISPKLLRPGTVCLGALSVERILSAGNQLPLLLIG